MQPLHSHHVEMLEVNWRAFDLNLLVVFDAVLQDAGVTRAAKRLGMSQPAMSHALNRLRYLLKDQLFIRTPKGMVPTPRAAQLALPLRHALAEMQRALEPETFVAAQATRRFSIAINNYAAIVMAAPLVAAVSAAAPGVQLDLRPSGTLDVFDHLDRGDLDVAIGTFDAVGERFGSAALLKDQFVAVMRTGHPAGRGKLSADTFGAQPHVAISSSGDDTGFIDRSLATRGAKRRIALRLPYLAAGAVLAHSDMVATLSRRVAETLVQGAALQVRELPFASPTIHTSLAWHRKLDGYPAHRWLRDLIVSVSRRL
jgi:DNA-binding transcriptional LysR family regulator